jgi:mutator protein MutT
MRSYSPIQAAGALVVRADGRLLLARRGRAPAKGEWSLPGGKVEPGEAPADAVVREVQEEANLAVRVIELLAIVPIDSEVEGERFSYAIHEYLCAPLDEKSEIRAGDDADAVRWVSLSEVAGLVASVAVRDVIDAGLARRRARA